MQNTKIPYIVPTLTDYACVFCNPPSSSRIHSAHHLQNTNISTFTPRPDLRVKVRHGAGELGAEFRWGRDQFR